MISRRSMATVSNWLASCSSAMVSARQKPISRLMPGPTSSSSKGCGPQPSHWLRFILYVDLLVRDVKASRTFYAVALESLGYTIMVESTTSVSFGVKALSPLNDLVAFACELAIQLSLSHMIGFVKKE